jgi:hypothetical protein
LAPARAPDPAGIPSTAHTQGSDSLRNPLLRFDPPLRYVPKTSPWPLSRGQLSWDFVPLQRIQATGVHVLPFNGKAVRQQSENHCRLSVNRSHPADYGAALRLSQPLSDFAPPAALLPFSDKWRSWGCVLQGFFLSQSPDSSSPPVYPVDVAPAGCAASVPG